MSSGSHLVSIRNDRQINEANKSFFRNFVSAPKKYVALQYSNSQIPFYATVCVFKSTVAATACVIQHDRPEAVVQLQVCRAHTCGISPL